MTISESLCEVLDIDIEIDEYYGTRLHQEAEEVEVCRTLADLIDRPMCRMVVDDRSTWLVRCTNCGHGFEQEDVWVHGPWKFCPKCGAEMVE